MGRVRRLSLIRGGLVTVGASGVIGFGAVGFPDYARAATIACIAMTLIGGVLYLPIFREKEDEVDDKKKPTVIGTEVENSGTGIGLDISSIGTPESPSFGPVSVAIGQPGQTVIGTRIVQSGPGVGMRVVQSGPGVGFRSIAIVGTPPKEDSKD